MKNIRTKHTAPRMISALAATLALCSLSGRAETPPEDEPAAADLAPTVVTGDLWESGLERISASVSVVEEPELDALGRDHLEDLVRLFPNVTWTGGTSRPRYFQIRGVGENSQFEGETPDSSIRFLIDDLDLTGLGTVAGLFDVRQVEVLRGPQAGAYGANAAGGLIRLSTYDPTPYWTGRLESTVGSEDLIAGGAAVGGPLLEDEPERLTFRLAVHGRSSDGFFHNRFLDRDDTNEKNESMGRLKLRWIANEDLQWDTTFFYADADNGYDQFSLDNTGFDTFSDEPGRDEQETRAASLRGVLSSLPAAELTTITRFSDTDTLYSFDADWTDRGDPRSYNGFSETVRNRQVWSQELRLDSTDSEPLLGLIDRWTLGLYAQGLKEDSRVDYSDDFGRVTSTSEYQTESYAVFAQGAHDLSENLRLILGLRTEYHRVDVSSSGTSFGFPIGGESEQSDPLFGGKATVEVDLNPEHLWFTSFARGYRAAGANIASFTLPGDPLTYDKETLWNAETGLKSRWFDDALRTRITAFYLHRDDVQLRDSAGAGGFFRYLTVNGEDAVHVGLEGDAEWFITDDLSLRGALGLLDTERDTYTDPGGVVPERELSNAPSYTYTLGARYEPGQRWFADVELLGRDEYFESNSHREKRNAYAIVNASVGLRMNRWTVTVWGRNLFDEEYEQRVFLFSNELDTSTPDPFDFAADRRFESPADPRQVGVSLAYQW